MSSTVKSRPNHYETLGLAPTASADEITRAFAREVSIARPRAFGGMAEVGIAYATLRDPARRKAYDRSIGLSERVEPVERPDAAFSFHAVHAAARFRPEPIIEPRPAPFIAAPQHEPVQPEARHDPPPAPKLRPAEAKVELKLEQPAEHHMVPWKRTAAAVGVLIAGVGLLGGYAGWDAGNAVEEAGQPARAVTVALPQPKAVPATIKSPVDSPAPFPIAVQPQRRTTVGRVAPVPARRQPTVLADPLAPSDPSLAEANPAEQAAASPATAVPASLPLSEAVIARTIGRIGYACGRIASTSAIEGEAPGVVKVTCTSGQSYRAAPVRGRYHFRRLGGH